MSDGFPFRFHPLSPPDADEVAKRRNAAENRRGARAFEPGRAAIERISRQRSARAERLASWIEHPDERVALAALRDTRIMRHKAFRETASLVLARAHRERAARGTLWSPLLDAGECVKHWSADWSSGVHEFLGAAEDRIAALTDIDQIERLLEYRAPRLRHLVFSRAGAVSLTVTDAAFMDGAEWSLLQNPAIDDAMVEHLFRRLICESPLELGEPYRILTAVDNLASVGRWVSPRLLDELYGRLEDYEGPKRGDAVNSPGSRAHYDRNAFAVIAHSPTIEPDRLPWLAKRATTPLDVRRLAQRADATPGMALELMRRWQGVSEALLQHAAVRTDPRVRRAVVTHDPMRTSFLTLLRDALGEEWVYLFLRCLESDRTSRRPSLSALDAVRKRDLREVLAGAEGHQRDELMARIVEVITCLPQSGYPLPYLEIIAGGALDAFDSPLIARATKAALRMLSDSDSPQDTDLGSQLAGVLTSAGEALYRHLDRRDLEALLEHPGGDVRTTAISQMGRLRDRI